MGTNYRAACRGRTLAEMAAKLGIVEEEGDESQFWIELLEARDFGDPDEAKLLWRELDEVIAIVVASRKTIRSKADRR